jgi:hypothetical protein
LAQNGFAKLVGRRRGETLAMPRTIFRPLLRKAPGRTAKAPRAARSFERIGRQAMIDRRDHCMAEIVEFESWRGDSASLVDKARQLLTRHWSVSSWRARADILRTAEWLIGVGKKGARLGAASVVPPNCSGAMSEDPSNDSLVDSARYRSGSGNGAGNRVRSPLG